jgi:polynucleotide 5'-kinase involved in rRNA processing
MNCEDLEERDRGLDGGKKERKEERKENCNQYFKSLSVFSTNMLQVICDVMD